MKPSSIPLVLAGLLAATGTLALVACDDDVRPEYVTVSDGDVDIVVTDVAPPPPQEEVVGVAPGPDYFWIGGVWFWEGGQHVWHPGHWEHRREGFHYVAHHWDNDDGHWHLRGGTWRRDRG